MFRNFLRIALSMLPIFPAFLVGCANVGAMNTENKAMQFSYTTNGGADGSINSYGNNEVSVSSDMLRVQIGDSDSNRNINGVGIYELKLQSEDLGSARKLAQLLCLPKDPKSDWPTYDLYVAKCDDGMRSSSARDFNRTVGRQIFLLVDSLTNAAVQDGRKIVKFDLSLLSIERSPDGFLVSVRFLNNGDYPIKFTTPDKWNTGIGKNMDILGVSGSRVGSRNDKFGLALAGRPLADPKQFPDGKIDLAPHSSVTFKLKTASVGKFAAGTYDLNAGAFMDIEVSGIQSSLVRVNFHSDYKNPTRVTFDRDYPSTPQEHEQWEAYQRTRMSYFPVKPSETFAEDGLYRAVRTIGGYRGLNLKAFKAGDVATTENVRMPMESAVDINLDGPVQWVWEASAPTPVKQWSLDVIDGTQQYCKPGTECPRSGRWVARIDTGPGYASSDYRYDLSRVVSLRRGQQMPSVQTQGDADWEWVGA
jgi:hypothetical protein